MLLDEAVEVGRVQGRGPLYRFQRVLALWLVFRGYNFIMHLCKLSGIATNLPLADVFGPVYSSSSQDIPNVDACVLAREIGHGYIKIDAKFSIRIGVHLNYGLRLHR